MGKAMPPQVQCLLLSGGDRRLAGKEARGRSVMEEEVSKV